MNVFKTVNGMDYLTDGEGTVTAGNNNISVVGCFGYKPFKVVVMMSDKHEMTDTFETKSDAVKYFKSVTKILKGE